MSDQVIFCLQLKRNVRPSKNIRVIMSKICYSYERVCFFSGKSYS